MSRYAGTNATARGEFASRRLNSRATWSPGSSSLRMPTIAGAGPRGSWQRRRRLAPSPPSPSSSASSAAFALAARRGRRRPRSRRRPRTRLTRAAMPAAAKSPGWEPTASRASSSAPRSSRGAAERDGDVGPPRLHSAASRRESSSPFSSSSSARRGDQGVEEALDLARGTAPTNSSTTAPSRKALTAGIPWTSKRAASDWLASTSTFASRTRPPREASAASSAGVRVRQGPHHSAQKSTTTGVLLRELDHVAVEGRLGHVQCHRPRLVLAGIRSEVGSPPWTSTSAGRRRTCRCRRASTSAPPPTTPCATPATSPRSSTPTATGAAGGVADADPEKGQRAHRLGLGAGRQDRRRRVGRRLREDRRLGRRPTPLPARA